MLVLWPESATTNAEDAFIKVDIVPRQAERLALSKTQRERDGPPCAVPMLAGDLQETESTWDYDNPAASVGLRDALLLVIVDAVRNTYRGAQAVLGADSPRVRAFEESQPDLKGVRDRFEHFDDYLRGTGNAQKTGSTMLSSDDVIGLDVRSSSGGGLGGHSIDVAVRERDGEKTYTVQTGLAVDAACILACAVLEEVGLYDDGHAERCVYCKPSDPNPND
jgi:hypothetical protein